MKLNGLQLFAISMARGNSIEVTIYVKSSERQAEPSGVRSRSEIYQLQSQALATELLCYFRPESRSACIRFVTLFSQMEVIQSIADNIVSSLVDNGDMETLTQFYDALETVSLAGINKRDAFDDQLKK